MVKSGLRSANFPNEEETQVLLEHVVTNYGGHTHQEIKLAFDMAMTGKLTFPEKQDHQHYENFSCEYFSRIMNAYRKWAGETYRSVIDKKVEKKENMKIESGTEEKVDVDEVLWNQTEYIVQNNKGSNIYIVPVSLYEWANTNGNINVTAEQKMWYIEQATLVRHSVVVKAYESNPHSLDAKITLNEFNQMRATKKYSQAEHDKIIDLSKRMIVFDMMKRNEK